MFDAFRTLSLINANLGSKDIQSEVTVVAEKTFEEVVVPCAGRNGALLGSGSGPMRRLSEGEVWVVKAQLRGVGGHLVGGQR